MNDKYKLIEQNNSRLLYEKISVAPQAFYCALVYFFVSGIIWAGFRASLFEESTLACNRLEPTLVKCKIIHSKIFGLVKKEPTVISNLAGAEVIKETHTYSDGDEKVSFTPYLLDSNRKEVPLPAGNPSGRVAQIKQFVADPSQSTLNFSENNFLDGASFVLIPSVIFCFLGSLLALNEYGKPIKQIELDKSQDYLRVWEVYKQQKRQEHKVLLEAPLSHVTPVLLEKKDSDGDSSYKVVLTLKEHTHALELDSSNSRKISDEKVKQLQAFLEDTCGENDRIKNSLTTSSIEETRGYSL